jgi:hypothetical protein
MRFVSNFIVGLTVNLSSESFQLRLTSWAIFECAPDNIFVRFHMLVFVQVLEEEACLEMQRSVLLLIN